VKQVVENNIQQTLDRSTIWLAQTPQTFHREILISALQHDMDATDEASMVEAISGNVAITQGFAGNFKITTTEDWQLAEGIIANNG
jgi:2-C-methyl-D-erythritol 4-phosphate cytidylyltransferase